MTDALWEIELKSKALLTLVGWLLYVAVGHAHHSFYTFFDFRGRVTVEGVITEVRLVNPHSRITMEVENDQGESETWLIETSPGLSLTISGWTQDTVPLGSNVTALGFPAHSGGHIMTLIQFTFEDGREVRAKVDQYLKPTGPD